MQTLTAYPRASIPAQTTTALLQGTNDVKVTTGIELVLATKSVQPYDPAAILSDWTEILVPDGSSVAYDNTAKIPNTATLVLDPAVWELLGNASLLPDYEPAGGVDATVRRIYWGNPRARVRPFMELSAPGLPTARFHLGVYVLATPQATMDTATPLYTVTCYDQISMFDVPLTQSITYPPGTVPFLAAQALIQQFDTVNGATAHINAIAGNVNASLSAPLSWSIDSGATYLDVINELLATIGYNALWSDWDGTLVLSPFQDPRTQLPDWVLDMTDPINNIVALDGSWQPDIYQVPNTWLFIQNNLIVPPVEGAGQYTFTNQSSGPSSIDKQLGRVLLSYHALDAANQTDLMAQGNQIVVNETLPAETFTINTSPFPLAWHKDVIKFVSDTVELNYFAADSSGDLRSRQCYVASWSLPLNGSNMSWTMGTVG